MRTVLLIAAVAALSACAPQSKRAVYTCANGPTLVVVYSEDQATITFPSGRVEVLDATDKPEVYARPGMALNATGFRRVRLDEGTSSLGCDQLGS